MALGAPLTTTSQPTEKAITGELAEEANDDERTCPISGEPMVEPVTTTLGTTYDKAHLLKYWADVGPYDVVLSKLAAEETGAGGGELVVVEDMVSLEIDTAPR